VPLGPQKITLRLTFGILFGAWFVSASSQRPQKQRFPFASIKTSWLGSKLKGQVIKLASILSCVPFAMHRSNYSLKRTAASGCGKLQLIAAAAA
jgi:hypothetical protein